MKKLVYLAMAVVMFASCAASKNATKGAEYTAEEVELVGYGVGKSSDESTARRMAMTDALGGRPQRQDESGRTNSKLQLPETERNL